MAPDDTKYSMFDLKNQEFTFDVDVSKLPCGLNGALYFVSMDADGGLSEYAGDKVGETVCRTDSECLAYPANASFSATHADFILQAGAKYGTG